MFLSMQNINFITQFFLEIFQRHCILVILSTLDMSGHTYQQCDNTITVMLICAINQLHPSLLSWNTVKVLQTFCKHAVSNINMLLTRNFPFDSDDRQWSHFLMLPLDCLWAKSNDRTRDQFECDVTFFFCFDSVRSHAQCCSIVCWREWGFLL